MSAAYIRDLSWRVVRTALFSAVGVAASGFDAANVWWALPIAAVLSLATGFIGSASTPGDLVHAVEKGGWTLAQVAIAAVPVDLWGVPAEWVPLITAGLALLKGFLARKVGNPENAATLS